MRSRSWIAATVEIGPFPDGDGVGGGNHAELRPGLGGQDLDLQPGAEAGLVGEQAGDLRQCVAVYQGGPSSCRTLYEPETARSRPLEAGSGSDRGEPRRARRSIGGDELHQALERARRSRNARPAASPGASCASFLRRRTVGRCGASPARWSSPGCGPGAGFADCRDVAAVLHARPTDPAPPRRRPAPCAVGEVDAGRGHVEHPPAGSAARAPSSRRAVPAWNTVTASVVGDVRDR